MMTAVSRNFDSMNLIVRYAILLLLLSPISFSASCSDSENKNNFIRPTTKVIINLGNSSGKSIIRREAAMPSDITSINLAVTGPAMVPIARDIAPSESPITLEVPSGDARVFAVAATSPSMIYSGTTTVSLPPNETVEVPIVMNGRATMFQNEGTADSPIDITVNAEVPHVGQVGTGRSYYRAYIPTDFSFSNVTVAHMTDDVDLWGHALDSSYSSSESPIFMSNYCGRRKDENIITSAYAGEYYYFTVDGSHTLMGAAFTIYFIAENGGLFQWPVGTIEDPLMVPVGLMGDANTMRMNSSFVNYCYALVDLGRQYWINIYNYSQSIYTSICTNPLFENPTVSNTFTATSNTVFFTETGVATDNEYKTAITANEGTLLQPVGLFPSASANYRRANFCMVGGASSSYYRFPVDPSVSYNITLSTEDGTIVNNLNLYIYADPVFSNPLYSFLNTNSYEGSIGQFPSGFVYVRAEDYFDDGSNFYGATFVIDIAPLP